MVDINNHKHIRANTTLGQNSVLYKTIPVWNHLPPAAIEFRSAAFKRQLVPERLVWSAAQHHSFAWYSTEEACKVNIEKKTIAANWCLIVRTWGIHLQHWVSACPALGRRHQNVTQCCRSIQPSFSKCLGIQKVCLGFKRIHRNVDKRYFKNLKTLKKIKLWSWG